jgi:hypothetical protein
MLTDSSRFSSQLNITQQKIITRNLTVKDNINHITCTQVIFGLFVPGKNLGEKTSASYLDFIIIELENIEIFYNKINPAKYKTSSTNVWPPSANPPDQVYRKKPLQC